MRQARREDVEQALRTVVSKFGPTVAEQPDRLRALLHDLLADSARPLRAEINAVVAVAAGRSPSALTSGPSSSAGGGRAAAGDSEELGAWARSAWAGALAVGSTALPGTALPPQPHDGAGRAPAGGSASTPADGGRVGTPGLESEGQVDRPPSGDRSSSGGPAPGEASPPVAPPQKGGSGRWRRAAPLAAAGVAAVVAGTVGFALAGGGDPADVLAGSPAADRSVQQEGPEPADSESIPGPTSSPATTPASCPLNAPGSVRAEYDVRHGVDLAGTVTDPQQRQALASAASSTGLAVRVNDFLSEGDSGPSPQAVQTLSAMLPAVLENLSDVRAVAVGEEVCLEGAFIDEEARSAIEATAAEVQARGGQLALLLEQHPVDDHGAHEAILQSAITQAVDNQRIPFVTGSAELLPEAQPILDRIVHVLNDRFPERRYPGLVVTVEGHTDDVGSREANLALSQARAESVLRALVAKGVPPNRLQAVGHGPDNPLTTNATEEGRQQNRRVVFNVGKEHTGAVHGDPAAGGGGAGHQGH